MSEALQLAGLFAAAFTAATLLPGGSEAVLAAVLAGGAVPPWSAILVATVGNTLGSVVNWALGRFLVRFRDRRWFPVDARRFDEAVARYRRFGAWSLLLSWVPVIGDPITVVSGVLRTPLWLFVPIVALAKLLRYLGIAGLVSLV